MTGRRMYMISAACPCSDVKRCSNCFAGLTSSGVITWLSKYVDIDSGDGRVDSVMPVRGIVNLSRKLIDGTFSDSDKGGVGTPASPNALWGLKDSCSETIFSSSSENSSSVSSSIGAKSSLNGRGGLTSGLEFVKRNKMSLHTALKLSRSTTTRHLLCSPPLRLASISQSNSVYCAIFNSVAMFEYRLEEFDQNIVYRACGVCFVFSPGVGFALERVGDASINSARLLRRLS